MTLFFLTSAPAGQQQAASGRRKGLPAAEGGGKTIRSASRTSTLAIQDPISNAHIYKGDRGRVRPRRGTPPPRPHVSRLYGHFGWVPVFRDR